MISIILHAYVHFLTVTATLKCLFLWLVIYIDWSVSVNTGSVCSSIFLTFILQNGLTQVVNLPTDDDNCCIDLVMVSDVVMMLDISVVDPFAISCDH